MSKGVSFHAKSEVVIEQLFADIPTTTFSDYHHDHKQQHQAHNPSEEEKAAKSLEKVSSHEKVLGPWNFTGGSERIRRDSSTGGSTQTKSSGRSKDEQQSTSRRPATQSKASHSSTRAPSSSNQNVPMSKGQAFTKKMPKKISSLMTGRSRSGQPTPSKSMVEAGKGKRRSSGVVDRMTAATALAMFGNKLTTHERDEILEYPVIHFLGLKAKKINPDADVRAEKAFDDPDHFYIAVPHDHIAYRFEVAEKPVLGKGTFGQVIKATDHKYSIQVALKIVRNEKIYLKQSREELRILQILKKQDPHGIYNIISMNEFFMFRNHMVISFELLGMNLYQVIRKNGGRGLALSTILPIARAILKCLELLFKNRIIHCDIKPENVMLRKNGELGSIKVGDFGSSCYEQQQIYHYIQSRYYRAPEVILGLRYGPAIDMWSLGCVLAELATGYPVIMGSNEDDQLAAIEETCGAVPKDLLSKSKKASRPRKGRGPPGSNPISQLIPGSDSFKDVVNKMLEVDPGRRPTPFQLSDHPWLSTNRSSSNVVSTTSTPTSAISSFSKTSSKNTKSSIKM